MSIGRYYYFVYLLYVDNNKYAENTTIEVTLVPLYFIIQHLIGDILITYKEKIRKGRILRKLIIGYMLTQFKGRIIMSSVFDKLF